LIALLGVALCSDIMDREVTLAFGQFMNQHHRKYDTIEETMRRYAIFAKNYRIIEEHNAQDLGFTLGVNQFSDLTPEEIKEKFLIKTTNSFDNPCRIAHVKGKVDPVVDWRKAGAVNPMRNQGSCGSCWAFSTIGALEGLYKIKKGTLEMFSEQELVDCSRSYGNEGCNGGWMSWAFEYIKDKGISKRSEYPYTGRDGTCKKKSNSFQIAGCVNITAEDNDMLLEGLNLVPVSVAVSANNAQFMNYRSGIIKTGCGAPNNELDHGITLVGAGVENSVNFWIVRNSWGTGWGEAGYARILRVPGKAKSMCGIAKEACYPSV